MASRLALSPSQLGSPAPLLPSSSSCAASSADPRLAPERRDAGHLPRSCIGFSSNAGRARLLAITTKAVEQASTASVIGGVVEVTQETFWPVVEAAGDKLVVLDMYTQWCGPCKIMYPKIVELSGKYTDVVFLKLDCNQANKALAKKLGVRVVPTFKLFKNRQEVSEVKGAKFDELVQSIEKARAS